MIRDNAVDHHQDHENHEGILASRDEMRDLQRDVLFCQTCEIPDSKKLRTLRGESHRPFSRRLPPPDHHPLRRPRMHHRPDTATTANTPRTERPSARPSAATQLFAWALLMAACCLPAAEPGPGFLNVEHAEGPGRLLSAGYRETNYDEDGEAYTHVDGIFAGNIGRLP